MLPNCIRANSSRLFRLNTVIFRTKGSSSSSPPPTNNESTETRGQETALVKSSKSTDLKSSSPKPVGPINIQTKWRNDELKERIDSEFKLDHEPVILPNPVKQKLIARIPVEYHGTLPDNFNNETEWLPIFRLPYVTRFRAIIRLKIYLTGVSIYVVCSKFLDATMGNLNISGASLLVLSSVSITGLLFIGDVFRRMVAQIYVTRDLQYVRFCRFTFFGRRRDLVLPAEQIIRLPELNADYRKPFYKIRFREPEQLDLERDEQEFYEQGLYMVTRHGGFLDRERFKAVMGNVFDRVMN